ncbi:MAG: cytochrome P460 family protein [Pseudomonadota bacterium]
MTTRLSRQVMAALLIWLGGVAVFAGAASEVYFPAGYRLWTVAKFKFIGPESANYAAQGGLRHHFANDQALASWGKFRDGSVIVDERVHAKLDDNGIWQEDDLVHVAVMRKDATAHPDTGGWYFNYFRAHDTAMGITPEQAKARCFDACHKTQEARDFVFSDPRR